MNQRGNSFTSAVGPSRLRPRTAWPQGSRSRRARRGKSKVGVHGQIGIESRRFQAHRGLVRVSTSQSRAPRLPLKSNSMVVRPGGSLRRSTRWCIFHRSTAGSSSSARGSPKAQRTPCSQPLDDGLKIAAGLGQRILDPVRPREVVALDDAPILEMPEAGHQQRTRDAWGPRSISLKCWLPASAHERSAASSDRQDLRRPRDRAILTIFSHATSSTDGAFEPVRKSDRRQSDSCTGPRLREHYVRPGRRSHDPNPRALRMLTLCVWPSSSPARRTPMPSWTGTSFRSDDGRGRLPTRRSNPATWRSSTRRCSTP